MSRRPGTPRTGVLRAQTAVLLFGLAGVLGKLSDLPAPLITLGRVAIAGVALAFVARARGVAVRPRSRRDLAILVGQGGLLALHWTAFFQAINVSSVAIGLLAFSSFPLFTAALEPLVLRQRPDAPQVVAALLILPGVYLLVPALTLRDAATAGVAWGLLAAATFAGLSVVNRWLGRRYASLTISLYQDGTAALVLLPVLLVLHPARLFTARELVILLALGLACTALAHTLFIGALRDITAQLASLIGSLEPVWGIAFAFILLREVPSGRSLLGGGVIVGATLLPAIVSLVSRRRRSNRPGHAAPGQPSGVASASDG